MARVEQVRIDERRGEQRGLLRTELRRRRPEILSCGCLGAVDPIAPLDHVQVQLEDALFGELRLETPGDDQLAQLADRILATERDTDSSRAAG